MDNKKYKFNVCLMGASFSTSNMGVSALAASMIKIIQDIRPDSEITLVIGNRSAEDQEVQVAPGKKKRVKVVNYRLSPKAYLREHLLWILGMALLQKVLPIKFKQAVIQRTPFLRALHEADFIGDIRGGDSFSDIYGLRRLFIGSVPGITALLLKKNLHLLPQTYGPYNSLLGRYLARFILIRASYIISRDIDGVDAVKNMTGRRTKLAPLFCPDVAFLLEPIRVPYRIVPKLPEIREAPLVGLNINGLLYNGGYNQKNMFDLKMDYREFVRLVSLVLLKNTTAHILFVPHTFSPMIESDPDAIMKVIDFLPDIFRNRVHIVEGRYDQSEIKGIIGLTDFFIGSRMHACIAALSQGVPTISVAYSRKFYGVFASVGVGDMVIDARLFHVDAAVNRILHCFHNRSEIKIKLQKTIGTTKDQIEKTFNKILKA